jgi:hypothetical protein
MMYPQNPRLQQFIRLLSVLILFAGQDSFVRAHMAGSNHAETAETTYKELNGIDRNLHREIRQIQGTKPSTQTLEQLKVKYDLSPRSDTCPVYFGQPTIRQRFSGEGVFRRATLDEVVAELKSGNLTPDDIPVQFIWVDGKRVTVNNRSLGVLYKAGIRPTKLVDRTGTLPPEGSESLEAVLRRLEVMGGKPSTEMLVRTGGISFDGRLTEASDWNVPMGEIVSMPDDLLIEASTCKQRDK